MRNRSLQIAGLALARFKINRVTRVATSDQVFFLKRRCWYAEPLIILSNRLFQQHWRVLPLKEWLIWEPMLYRHLYGVEVPAVAPNTLRLCGLPGCVLAELLEDNDWSVARKIDAIAAAVSALHWLHSHSVYNRGTSYRLSHADATVQNVIYDPGDGIGRWFDFETIHNPARAHPWRCADDLRALLYSAAARLPGEALPALADTLDRYPEREVLDQLRGIVLKLQRKPNLLHAAQTGISIVQQRALEQPLLSRL